MLWRFFLVPQGSSAHIFASLGDFLVLLELLLVCESILVAGYVVLRGKIMRYLIRIICVGCLVPASSSRAQAWGGLGLFLDFVLASGNSFLILEFRGLQHFIGSFLEGGCYIPGYFLFHGLLAIR